MLQGAGGVIAVRRSRASHAAWLRAALPGVFAVAAVWGIAVTLHGLIVTPAVDTGVFRSESHDGLALYYGLGLFHDPASGGYTGLLYTPLQPAVIALLDELRVWNGWPVLLTVAGVAAVALTIAWLGYRAAGPARELRLATAAGALGLGAIGIWLVTSLGGVLYLSWSDGLMWALAIGGLVAGAHARDARGAALAVALLTLAFWTKQTAIVPAAAFCAWLAALALRGHRSVRFAAATIAALVLVNLAVLGLLNLLTGGWELYFNFTLATRQARIYGLHQFASDLVHAVGPPALWCLALGLTGLGRDWRARLRLDSPATLLALFAVVGLPAAMYFRSKQGGGINQYFGVVWALTALAAIGWGSARREAVPDGAGLKGRHPARSHGAAADLLVALAVVVAVVATVSGSSRFDARLQQDDHWPSIPADIRALALRAPLFQPFYTDLTPGRVYPDVFEAADLLAADAQPMQLVRALTSRRFEYAVSYRQALGPAVLGTFDSYASAYGRYESGYFWKLDRVIAAGYAAAPGLPPGVLARRPGANRAAALADCFGPFRIAGGSWEIRAGGGFWCHAPDSQAVTLGPAPAPLSQLVTTGSYRVSGSIGLRAAGAATVSVTVGSRRLAPVRLRPGEGASLLLFGARGPVSRGPVSIVATAGRGVRVDLSRLRLRP